MNTCEKHWVAQLPETAKPPKNQRLDLVENKKKLSLLGWSSSYSLT
jgi:hypothetical protein